MAMVRTDDAVDSNGQQPADTARTPGALLREARERAGLSRPQLAEATNLLVSQVTAIEADRYDQLPGDTFTIGYLRNYARAVGIDPDRVVQAFFAARPQSRPMNRRVEGRVEGGAAQPRKPIRLDQGAPRRHYWGLAAAALVVAGLWGWQQIQEPVEVLPLTADINGVELPLPGGLEQVVDTSSLLDAVELLPATEPKPAAAAPAAKGGEGVPLRAVASADALPRATLTAATAGDSPLAVAEASAGGDRLNLRFSADCWVEVKDRDNKVLVAALKRADEQLTIEGRGPFKVLLGFAPGVEMAFNGRPVDIEPNRGSRSARLIVGNS